MDVNCFRCELFSCVHKLLSTGDKTVCFCHSVQTLRGVKRMQLILTHVICHAGKVLLE